MHVMEKLRGFRDIYPEEAEPRKRIFKVAEDISERFGFSKVEFPSLELLELYKIKSGDELVNQIFSFTDRGNRSVALIPEATPSLVRMISSRKDLRMPAKWYSFQRFWRYEEPQAGRQREFYQFNADIFGVDSYQADAEIVGLAASILDDLGLRGKYIIYLNSREFMESFLSSYGISDPERAYLSIDRMKKKGEDATVDELTELGLNGNAAESLVDSIGTAYSPDDFPVSNYSIDSGGRRSLDRLLKTARLIRGYTDSDIKIDLSIVRGLSYYTGIVFEAFYKFSEFRSILGGGRYDSLSQLISGTNIPSVGFGMGDVVLEAVLKNEGIFDRDLKGPDVFVCYSSAEIFEYALKVANRLRKGGLKVSVSLSVRSISSQLKAASKGNYRYAAIIGERELNSQEVSFKELSSGTQKAIPFERIDNFQKFFDQ